MIKKNYLVIVFIIWTISSCKKESVATNLLSTEEYALANAGKGSNKYVNLKQGLMAYYPFNGNANDESGNNNNGTINGAILTKDRFLKNNKAFRFENGASVTVPHNPSFGFTSNSSFSVSIWAFKTGAQDVMHLIGKRVQGNDYFNWQIAYVNTIQPPNTTLDGLSLATLTGGVLTGTFTKN